jgi:hypothetical protein
MDNKAKAFAQLHLHGRELEEIDDIEFKNTYRDSIGKKYSSNLEFREFTDFPCTCDSYSIDGYDYYIYNYLITYHDGHDCDTYVCKVKRLTHDELYSYAHIGQ